MTQTPEQIAVLLDRVERSYLLGDMRDPEACIENLQQAVEGLLLVVRTILENRNDD